MRLTAARVRKVMSVQDSGRFAIDPEITAVVGKNESGKTAMLQALYRANPLPSGHPSTFTTRRDYPRRDIVADRDIADDVRPVTLELELTYHERRVLEQSGTLLPPGPYYVSRHYGDDELHWSSDLDGTPLDATADVVATLSALLPGFQYFDDHNVLPGSVSVKRLQELDPLELSPSERTALALLRLAGVADEPFTEDDYAERTAALEATATRLTEQLLRYWSQNHDLSIQLDLETHGVVAPEPWLHIRVRDNRQGLSLNVSERSTGFIWFFSFLTAFSEFGDETHRVILLDEPGHNLHATAQADLLRYVNEQLGTSHQVIYSTHSPYLIDSNRLSRARVLENDPEHGTRVGTELWQADSETTVPLLAALGADLVRALVSGSDQLLVSSPSDVTYLSVVGDLLRAEGGRALDPRWRITPIGGASGLPTVLTLLGTSTVSAAVLVDGPVGDIGAVGSLVSRGAIDADRLVPLTDITGTLDADVEDLFDVGWYLKLLEASGGPKVPRRKVTGTRFLRKQAPRRVVHQLETILEARYDRFQPAGHLLRHHRALAELDTDTKQRFQALIDRLNALL